jgi:hypothetical protein
MRYNRTRNFEPYGHAENKKTQKFVFRSALRPNQISFRTAKTQSGRRLSNLLWRATAAHPLMWNGRAYEATGIHSSARLYRLWLGGRGARAQERCVLDGGRGFGQHHRELVALRLRCVVARQSGGAFHLKDDRIKRAVRVLCRAEIAQACVRLGGLIMLAGELPRTTHADVEIFDQAIPD